MKAAAIHLEVRIAPWGSPDPRRADHLQEGLKALSSLLKAASGACSLELRDAFISMGGVLAGLGLVRVGVVPTTPRSLERLTTTTQQANSKEPGERSKVKVHYSGRQKAICRGSGPDWRAAAGARVWSSLPLTTRKPTFDAVDRGRRFPSLYPTGRSGV